MEISQRLGRTTGALMLAHLALGLIGPYVVLVPMNAPPGFLENAAGMAGSVRVSVLALVIGAMIPLVIAAIGWPRWRTHAPTLGLLLMALGATSLALQLVENTLWLSLLSVSEAYQGGTGTPETFASAAVALKALFRWGHYSHILILIVWILLLFAALRQAELLPRWITAFGILGCLAHLVGIPLPEFLGFRLPSAALWGVPLAVVYLIAAVFLVVRGFPPRTDDSTT